MHCSWLVQHARKLRMIWQASCASSPYSDTAYDNGMPKHQSPSSLCPNSIQQEDYLVDCLHHEADYQELEASTLPGHSLGPASHQADTMPVQLAQVCCPQQQCFAAVQTWHAAAAIAKTGRQCQFLDQLLLQLPVGFCYTCLSLTLKHVLQLIQICLVMLGTYSRQTCTCLAL